jgi:hypothetical protein
MHAGVLRYQVYATQNISTKENMSTPREDSNIAFQMPADPRQHSQAVNEVYEPLSVPLWQQLALFLAVRPILQACKQVHSVSHIKPD